jgi:hypothetical protein
MHQVPISRSMVLPRTCPRPLLPEARKIYVDGFLAVYGDDPFLVRLLIETGRFFVFNIIASVFRPTSLDRP